MGIQPGCFAYRYTCNEKNINFEMPLPRKEIKQVRLTLCLCLAMVDTSVALYVYVREFLETVHLATPMLSL